MKYERESGFSSNIEPMTNVMYYKVGNETAAIIHVAEDWSMKGDILKPELFIGWKFGFVSNEVEYMVLNMLPSNRQEVLDSYKLKEFDCGLLVYMTRGIRFMFDDWLAWDERDRIEDYHPRYMPEEKTKGLYDTIELGEAEW